MFVSLRHEQLKNTTASEIPYLLDILKSLNKINPNEAASHLMDLDSLVEKIKKNGFNKSIIGNHYAQVLNHYLCPENQPIEYNEKIGLLTFNGYPLTSQENLENQLNNQYSTEPFITLTSQALLNVIHNLLPDAIALNLDKILNEEKELWEKMNFTNITHVFSQTNFDLSDNLGGYIADKVNEYIPDIIKSPMFIDYLSSSSPQTDVIQKYLKQDIDNILPQYTHISGIPNHYNNYLSYTTDNVEKQLIFSIQSTRLDDKDNDLFSILKEQIMANGLKKVLDNLDNQVKNKL